MSRNIDESFRNIAISLFSREVALDRFLSPVDGRAQGCCIFMYFFIYIYIMYGLSLFCYLAKVIWSWHCRLPSASSASVNREQYFGWVNERNNLILGHEWVFAYEKQQFY